MKIAWASNPPWARSGYGIQTRLIMPRIVDVGYDAFALASCNFAGFPVPFDNYTVCQLDAAFDTDILITFVDSHVYDPARNTDLNWVPWLIVDREPVSKHVVKWAKQATHVIACSRFGLDQLSENGIDASYIPCSYDPDSYYQVDRSDARAELGLSNDRFIVGIVAANQTRPGRKNLTQQIMAFADFARNHDDALLYLHTTLDASRGGEDLISLIDYLGIGDKVSVTHPREMIQGYEDDQMRALYNSFDVLSLVSSEEGFGVPLIEAQACGVPVITGDWTAMSELCLSGWAIGRDEADQRWNFGFQYTPRVSAIADRYEQAYRYASGMRGHVTSEIKEKYGVDNVFKSCWIPVLHEIECRIETAAPAALET